MNAEKVENSYIQALKAENLMLKAEITKRNKSAEILELLFFHSVSFLVILDRNYNYIRVNDSYGKVNGNKTSDFPGHNFFEFSNPAGIKEIFADVLRTKETYTFIAKPFTLPDYPEEKVCYYDWSITPVLDTMGEVDLLILTSQNVTEHVRDKAKLTESEERYRAIFDNSLDGILLALPDGTILSANPAACRMFGRNEEEMRALGRNGIVDPTSLNDPRVIEALQEREKTGNFYREMTLVRKDGTNFPGEVSSKLFKDSNGHILSSIIFRDITKRKQAEAALHRSEEKFSKAFENNQATMCLTRLKDNKFIDVNKKFAEVSGWSREKLLGKCALEVWVDPHDREAMLEKVYKFGYVENFETKLRKKSGEVFNVIMAINIIDIEGENYLLASIINITERKKVEEALRLSQELFFKAFNTNPLAMFITSIEDGTFMELNEILIKSSAYTREDLIGKSVRDIGLWVKPSDRDKYVEELMEKGIVRNSEVNWRIPSGKLITVLLSGAVINWQGEQCILNVSNNITELRRYQYEMARLDRLNLIGEMSASIAHEIRNPMTTVKGFLQLLKKKDRYIQDREYMDLMIEELDRANDIITEYLSLAKNKSIELRMQSLNERIETIRPLLQAKATKHEINVYLELGDIPYLMIDKAEIHQLILNLGLNGIDAMSAGGYLTIKTFIEGNGVTMAIQDQGNGMLPSVLEKIGIPFFTTKVQGTGLGLAVCYSIAQRHQAKVEVETNSQGTVFKVVFPICQAASYLKELDHG